MPKKRNKILALFTDVYKSKGGVPVFNQNLLRALSKVYHGRIIVFSINDVLKENSGHYYFEGCNRRKVRFVFKTLFTLIINKPDFIICGHVNISPLCLLTKKVFEIPYITVTHGIDAWDVKSIKKRKGLASSDIIVSVSNYTKVRIKEQFGLKEDKLFILPNAADGANFKPKPKPEYLIKNGNFQRDFFEDILKKLRNPRERMGDFNAQMASLWRGEKRLKELYYKYGLKKLQTMSNVLKAVSYTHLTLPTN